MITNRFTQRFATVKLKDPQVGQYIKKDRAANSGSGAHGGSYWKLFSKNDKQIGTIAQDGRWLRK